MPSILIGRYHRYRKEVPRHVSVYTDLRLVPLHFKLHSTGRKVGVTVKLKLKYQVAGYKLHSRGSLKSFKTRGKTYRS